MADFHLILAEDARPELHKKFERLVKRLNDQPDFVDQINLDDDADPVQKMFTASRVAKMVAADAEIEAGVFYTTDQVREHFDEKYAKWSQASH